MASEILGEGASAGPIPVAGGGACEIGEDSADVLSVSNVRENSPLAHSWVIVGAVSTGSRGGMLCRRTQNKLLYSAKVEDKEEGGVGRLDSEFYISPLTFVHIDSILYGHTMGTNCQRAVFV